MMTNGNAWLETLRPADVLDIAVLSILLFVVFTWLKGTPYRRVALAFSIVGVSLIVAQIMRMYLTRFVLQGFLAATAMALIVVFQDELRRGFERVAVGMASVRGRQDGVSEMVGEIVDASFEMAKANTGALIVFEGKEPLARLVSGGFPIEGRLSNVLLQSIFNPTSPGHDGAVIVKGGRVTKFAAHLPLAKNVPSPTTGTRHAAALGVCRRSDALAVVVSEERGEVSLVRGAHLQVVHEPQELARQLEAFVDGVRAPASLRPSSPKLLWTTGRALLSVATASLLWIVFAPRIETVQRTFEVAIQYRNLPEELFVKAPSPETARVTLSGVDGELARLDAGDLIVSLDVAKITEGDQSVPVTNEEVERPRGLVVRDVHPAEVQVAAERLVPVRLDVVVRTDGALSPSVTLEKIETKPSQIELLVPRSAVPGLQFIETEAIDLGEITGSTTQTLALSLPEGARLERGTATVEVRVHVTPRNDRPPA